MDHVQLTYEQQEVVNSNARINIVLSTPGSGKSTVIANRAFRIWRETGEPILICTFSKKAVEDLNSKLENLNGSVTVKTIHSVAYSIVKENWDLLGNLYGAKQWSSELSLVDKEVELDLYKKHVQPRFESLKPMDFYNQVHKFREFGLSPTLFQQLARKGVAFPNFRREFISIIPEYEKTRIQEGFVTFEDMQFLARELLKDPNVSKSFADKYYHVMLDEAQDTSELQWDILRPVVYNSITSLCVGDLNQALYSWRGASGSILYDLSKRKDATVFRLTQSFRTSQKVTEFANTIPDDKEAKIVSKREEVGEIISQSFDDFEKEADWVLEHIVADLSKSTAIISRTNSYLELFERKLLERGIPFSGGNFYRGKVLEDIINFVDTLPKNIEDITPILSKIYCNPTLYSEFELLENKAIISKIKTLGYSRFKKLFHLRQEHPGGSLVLITGHASKGLEWDRVFIIGAHPGNFPHKLADNISEERNIFYVAATRAKDTLFITYQKELTSFAKELRNGRIEH